MADVVAHAREFVGDAGRAVTRQELLDHLAGLGVDGRKTGLAVRLKPILRESGEFEMDGSGIRLRGTPSARDEGVVRVD